VSNSRRPRKLEHFIKQTKAKQSNILWPDLLVGGRGVDSFFFKGSSNPSLIQRAAAWLFGIAYIGLGAMFFYMAANVSVLKWIFFLVGVGSCSVGGLIFYNGCRTRRGGRGTA